MKKLLILGALALLMAPVANAVTIQSYTVSISGSATTQTLGPGFLTGSGTASLDSSGVLTISSNQNLFLPGLPVNVALGGTQAFTGTLGGVNPFETLSGNSGTDTILTCADDLGNFVCGTYILPIIGIPNAFTSVGDPILFDNNPGGITTFSSVESQIGGAAIVTTNWTLTAVPEPGTLLLLGSGLMGIVAFGRKQA